MTGAHSERQGPDNPKKRLSQATLPGLNGQRAAPSFDRERCGVGVVHLGLGAFHRAHQAVYFDDLMTRQPSDWAICGVSLRSPAVRNQMAPQDGLYTLVELDGDEVHDRIIGSIREALYLADDRGRVLHRLADHRTKLVSLTVTEKAYCLVSLEDGLDLGHPGIAHDLSNPGAPVTVTGLLTLGLSMRRDRGIGAPTVLSCDNLPGNGRKLRRSVLEFAEAHDPSLARWIEKEAAFPCTMVDRIVPKTTEEDRAGLAQRLGAADQAMVKAEPFSQWVIEDRLNCEIPGLREAGALLVGDVDAYENLKLRLLLGSHSTIAYLGCLAGYRFVDQAMASPIGRLVETMMSDEILPVTRPPSGFDVKRYVADLLKRFRNSGLQHQCRQIAMDGSLKVPIRLLGTIQRCLEQDVACDRLILGVAAWMRYSTGIDEKGSRFDVDDPAAEVLAAIGSEAGLNAKRLTEQYLSLDSVFPPALAENPVFRQKLGHQLDRLLRFGARQASEI
jgi:fructuronate reductase